jgi:hypothetical protein
LVGVAVKVRLADEAPLVSAPVAAPAPVPEPLTDAPGRPVGGITGGVVVPVGGGTVAGAGVAVTSLELVETPSEVTVWTTK